MSAFGVNDLLCFDFELAGKIYVDTNGSVDYNVENQKFCEKDEQIYAWVVDDEIVYIGMASKGIKKRLGEHKGGWKGGSKTGLSKASLIREQHDLNKSISVYGRKCDYTNVTVEVLGVKKDLKISLVTHEEDILIQMLQPKWNVNGK
jgi:hypothetical protein